jgi:predicted nuclease of predicted toxin-antitoxin system
MPPRWLTKRSAFSRALPREISGRHGVSITTVQALRAAAHDAMHLREEGLIRLPDPDIVAKAAQEQRVVLTFDLDFGDILAVARTETPSVIIFRLRNQTPAAVNPRLFRVISECESELALARSSSLRTRDIASGDYRFDSKDWAARVCTSGATNRLLWGVIPNRHFSL